MIALHYGLRTVQSLSIRVCFVDTHKSTEQRVVRLQSLCDVWLLLGSSSNFLCRLPYLCDGSEFRGCLGAVFDDVHRVATFGAFKGVLAGSGFSITHFDHIHSFHGLPSNMRAAAMALQTV